MSPNAAKISYWEQSEEEVSPSLDRVNIMVVDDLPEKLLAYEAILEEMGQNLVMVRSGEEALKRVLHEEFAVILLDVNMPGMDGFETASLIRRRKKSSHTPIIFLTAFTDEVRMQQGYASGAVDYLPTPVVPEVLKAKVRVFIELSQMRRKAALQAEEHAMRTAAEELARRSDFLMHASEALSRSVREEDIVKTLSHLPIPYLADASLVWVTNGDTPPRIYRAWTEENTSISETPDATLHAELEGTIRQVMRSGRSHVMGHGFSDRHLPPNQMALVVPILLQGQMNAVLVLARGRNMAYQQNEIELATELASRAGVAMEKAILVQRIQEGDRRKDEFLAMLAHELRNPLAPIRNALQVMRRSPEHAQDAQETIERQLLHMIHLVDDLMDVSRITQGKIELRKEPVTLKDVLTHAVETAQPLLTSRRHEVTIDLPSQDIWLEADVSRLSQIFSNLLNNAAKYTNEGGRIILRAAPKNGQVEVTVEDNGIGIPIELLSSVFDLFAQVDTSLERTQGGLGIGLTLVKNLVELHQGTIKAASEGKGKGSRFIVTLPTIASPSLTLVKNEPSSLAEKKADTPLRVLIVDDNVASAQTMGWMVELDGHETRLAHTGLEAIALAESYLPDVVLLDIGMPGLNGYEACKMMRQQPGLRNTVFIAQTGWGQQEHRQRSKEAGFDHHLVKPVQLETLRQCYLSVSHDT